MRTVDGSNDDDDDDIDGCTPLCHSVICDVPTNAHFCRAPGWEGARARMRAHGNRVVSVERILTALILRVRGTCARRTYL